MATYWSDMCNSPTCVYRMFDRQGDLLYVGLTRNPLGRFSKHRRRDWWPQVVRTTLDWFPDRTAAQRAEREAIYYEHPIYNLVRPDLRFY